jgi:hypothetical protein
MTPAGIDKCARAEGSGISSIRATPLDEAACLLVIEAMPDPLASPLPGRLSQASLQPRRRVRVCPDAARVARCHHRPTNNKPQGLS